MKRKTLFIDLLLIFIGFILYVVISFYHDFLADLFFLTFHFFRKTIYISLFSLVLLQLVLAIFWKKARKWWIFLIYFVLGAITAVFGYVLDYTVYGEVPSDLDMQYAYSRENNKKEK
ncbi:MAG: hypothetical protein E7013_04355 [Alphaproteobacteria bacterium]|nr:hypothetical protein [Alphaproteobacteria bacterium]